MPDRPSTTPARRALPFGPRDVPSWFSPPALLALASAVATTVGVATNWTGWTIAGASFAAFTLTAQLVDRSRARSDAARRSHARAAEQELASLIASLAPGPSAPPPGAHEQSVLAAADALRTLSIERDNLLRVLDAVGDPVLVTAPGGAVAMWNTSAESFLARDGDRIRGRSIEELFTSADLVAVHSAAAIGVSRHATVRLAREGGTRLFEVIASPVQWRRKSGSEGGPGSDRSAAVLTLRDITELASASQLQTDFVANASHELRTPLSSIRAAVETLIDDSEDPPLRHRLLKMIATNVSRLEELIRDLLDLSRLESPDTGPSPCPMQISAIVKTLETEFTPACSARKLTLSFEMDPHLESMHSDPRLIDLILRNLIENSIKFAYEDTQIRVIGHAVTPAASAEGFKNARFQVIDRGGGIPLAGQARIFERFYQLDPARTGGAHRRGTGLGLALVKSAVEALKGTIKVESVWKQGTTMTVELPQAVAPTPAP